MNRVAPFSLCHPDTSVTASEPFSLFVLGQFGLGRIPTGAG